MSGVYRGFVRGLVAVENLLAEVAIAILVLCGLAICTDVGMRYFLGRPMMGSIELTEYALVYITFLGAAWAVPRGAHIEIDMVTANLPDIGKKLCALAGNLIALGVAAALTVFGASATWTAYVRHIFKPTQLEIPTWIVLIVIPIGALVLAMRYLVEVITCAEAIATGTPLPERERGPTID